MSGKSKTLIVALAMALAPAVVAKAQTAAGSPEARAAEETFRALVEKCDNTDVLVLRAQVRNKMSLASEEAAKSASDLLDQGLAKCGEGKLDEAKTDLNKALEVASAGVTDRLGADSNVNVEQTGADQTPATTGDQPEGEAAKPWWQFW